MEIAQLRHDKAALSIPFIGFIIEQLDFAAEVIYFQFPLLGS